MSEFILNCVGLVHVRIIRFYESDIARGDYLLEIQYFTDILLEIPNKFHTKSIRKTTECCSI